MDTLDTYRRIIERVLTEYAQIPYAYGDIQSQTIFDRASDHYLLMNIGWDKRRIHGCLVHIGISDGKCWMPRDGTEDGIATELEAAGIPKEHIVLAFRSSEIRKYTGYAVA
ncbi:XisI protein [Candidatus Poribacteria bacterium]|nr:XisI protein [Candidatus Poribacteria bacterium]